MKDYFNWLGCKSSKKERYIQLDSNTGMVKRGCKSSKKERYIQLVKKHKRFKSDVNHLKKKGTFNWTRIPVW